MSPFQDEGPSMKSSSPTAPGAPAKPPAPGAPAAGPAGPWQALGRKAHELWSNNLVRRTAYSLAMALLTLNLLEFPRQVFNPLHDASSHATFEYYAAHHFQFGKQVFQNVGPYGYIHYSYFYSGYLPVQRIILKTLYRLGLILLIVWAGRRLPHPALQLCWWAAFFIFQPFTWPLQIPGVPDFVRAPEMDWDQDYGYLTVYLSALYLLQNRKGWPFAIISGVLLFFLGFAALTKHTTFVLAAGAVGAVVLQKALRRELLAAAGTAVAYVLFLGAHWLMAGQALENFPGFVRGIFAFTAGYNEAQSRPRAGPDDADRPFGGSPAGPAERLQLSGVEARLGAHAAGAVPPIHRLEARFCLRGVFSCDDLLFCHGLRGPSGFSPPAPYWTGPAARHAGFPQIAPVCHFPGCSGGGTGPGPAGAGAERHCRPRTGGRWRLSSRLFNQPSQEQPQLDCLTPPANGKNARGPGQSRSIFRAAPDQGRGGSAPR